MKWSGNGWKVRSYQILFPRALQELAVQTLRLLQANFEGLLDGADQVVTH